MPYAREDRAMPSPGRTNGPPLDAAAGGEALSSYDAMFLEIEAEAGRGDDLDVEISIQRMRPPRLDGADHHGQTRPKARTQ